MIYLLTVSPIITQFTDRDERIKQLEYEGEELRGELQLKHRQLADLTDNIGELKLTMNGLREQNTAAEKEISRLEGNMESLQMNLASVHQKYKTEAVRMEEEGKRLHKDLSMYTSLAFIRAYNK